MKGKKRKKKNWKQQWDSGMFAAVAWNSSERIKIFVKLVQNARTAGGHNFD